jgi:hypothetical protein
MDNARRQSRSPDVATRRSHHSQHNRPSPKSSNTPAMLLWRPSFVIGCVPHPVQSIARLATVMRPIRRLLIDAGFSTRDGLFSIVSKARASSSGAVLMASRAVPVPILFEARASVLTCSSALACPVSSDAGRSDGFALFPGRFDPVRRVRHERGIGLRCTYERTPGGHQLASRLWMSRTLVRPFQPADEVR